MGGGVPAAPRCLHAGDGEPAAGQPRRDVHGRDPAQGQEPSDGDHPDHDRLHAHRLRDRPDDAHQRLHLRLRHRRDPLLGRRFIISGCLSIGAEKSPTECAVKGSQTMNIISAIFALLGIVAFIVDLNLNGLYRSGFDYYSYLVLLAGNGISIVLLIFTILEFCIAVATANFWCRATRLSSNEAMLIVPSATRVDLAVPLADLPQPPSYTEVIYDPKEEPS
ncbi:membrane-spanning 4-domains subfamily A member 15-like isoform 2-T2 [Ciconia maguari]